MATIPVKHYNSGMQGAPQLANAWGDMTALLDAVLVDGSTQAAAGKLSGITQPQVARALGSIRRLDASIRAAYLPVRRSP